MLKTKERLQLAYIDSYEQFYQRCGLPFGAKQQQTYEGAFNIDYAHPRGAYERNRIAWDYWDRKKGEYRLKGSINLTPQIAIVAPLEKEIMDLIKNDL